MFCHSFASNIAFVFLKSCQKIGLLINEELTLIPGCDKNELWCSYEKFKKIFEHVIEDCDFDRICETKFEGQRYKNIDDDRY